MAASPAAAAASPAPAPAARPAPRPVPVRIALPAAAGSGLALLLAFPPYDQWWLAPVGVALLAVSVHRRALRAGAGLGAVAGLVCFVPLLSWTNIEVGSVPWLLLATLQAGYLALLGAAAAYASPVVDRWRWSWPLLTAVAWVGQEALRSRTPFGGFPWGRLAFSQADSPLLGWAAVGGAPLVGFVVALAGGLLATAAWRSWRPVRPGALAAAGGLLAAIGLVLLSGLAVPPPPAATGPEVTVAVVQGNVPRLGLGFNSQRRAVLDNHVEATLELARQVAAGQRPAPDLVIWPENSSDIDPLANPDAGEQISRAADTIGAPILVGAILRGPDDRPRNVGLVWQPGTGPGEVYAKQHPVPFAEYLPLEPVVRPIGQAITGEIDRVAGFAPGEEPGVLAMGPVMVGDVICFEVAYDDLVRDTVTGGAQLLVVQTNNATFDEAEARQQLAMVRVRAVEHGRESLMASTVGISGFVGADGRVYDATGFFTRDIPVRTLSVADHRTVATAVGGWPELVLAGGAVAMLVAAFLARRPTSTIERSQ
ncbi:MAG: apolipoprotein N-acyltransferase [Micromonosporaceae bacterium]|nr:apolipoprotein N-acyltransferase [Micromonosporaceae bacterium]